MRNPLWPWRRLPWNWFINGLASWQIVPDSQRYRLFRLAGMKVGKFAIAPGYFISNSRLSVGSGSYISRDAYFDSHAPISLGDRVYVGPGASFVTSSHAMGPSEQRAGAFSRAPINVGRGAWIGANVTVLPGVTIGAGAVIAAGAVVTKDCESDALYAGVPARFVRTLLGQEQASQSG